MLEKLKELNKKSPLQLEAWEVDDLMQISLEQAEKIDRYESALRLIDKNATSGHVKNIVKKALEGNF